MRIEAIQMPLTDEFQDGLKEIRMKRLGKVVVLAGRNGSGKSRLFRRLADFVQNKYPSEPVSALKANVQTLEQDLQSDLRPDRKQDHERNLNDCQKALDRKRMITLSDERGKPTLVPFVPTPNLDDDHSYPENRKREHATKIAAPGFAAFSQGTFVFIQLLQNRWHEATHPHASVSEQEKANAIEEYERVQKLVKTFLGANLSRNIDGHATLFGKRLAESGLSDGQKVLLQFCVAIHAQATKLSDLIILMDEPENHLHPSAMLEVIEAIVEQLSNGQLWIATHSIPLIAHFDDASIWWMEDGAIRFAGQVPETVLDGLVGDEEKRGKLREFLNLPSQLAVNRFAAECLIAPTAVKTGPNDPQTSQIRELVNVGEAKSIALLDFGAGKGRLASAFHDCRGEMSIEKLRHALDYVAFDVQRQNQACCCDAISRIYDDSEHRFFSDLSLLLRTRGEKSFDLIVMCNVLHEIHPKDWLNYFSNESALIKLLKDAGFLLLAEVMQMPVGEHAHRHGFLVLDTASIRTLFQIPENDPNFKADSKDNGRLLAHLLPRRFLAKSNLSSLRAAVEMVLNRAKQEMISLRNNTLLSYRNGRLHAFWLLQFANASIVLEELEQQ